MKFRYNAPAPIGFQLAPMLDVVFLLLVFFIVTQSFEDEEPDLSLILPQTKEAKVTDKVSNDIIINIRKDGTIVINRHIYNPQQLEEKLAAVARLDKTMLVRLRADEKTEYAHAVQVLDLCLKVGLSNVSFSTRPATVDKSSNVPTP